MRVVIIADADERVAPDFGERAHRAFHDAVEQMAKGAAPDLGQDVKALEELTQILANAHADAVRKGMGLA